MNVKSGITITPNYSETNLIKMKHHSEVNWKIKKETGKIPTLTWSVVRTTPAYSNIANDCALCLYEKLEIFMYSTQKNF